MDINVVLLGLTTTKITVIGSPLGHKHTCTVRKRPGYPITAAIYCVRSHTISPVEGSFTITSPSLLALLLIHSTVQPDLLVPVPASQLPTVCTSATY